MKAMEQLEMFRHLQVDWDSYGAPMISHAAIRKAQALLLLLPGNWTAVPCNDGGVQLEQHEDGFDIEIQISPTVEVLTALEIDGSQS